MENSPESMDLVKLYQQFAEDHEIEINSGIFSQLIDLEKIKLELNHEAKEREDDCISQLLDKLQIIELLEIKEPIRIAFEQKIKSIGKLAVIDDKAIEEMYKEVIEKGGHEYFVKL